MELASVQKMTVDPAENVVVERVGRDAISLRALSMLRTVVFRGWPYLYDGSSDYEAAYLADFLGDDASVFIVARVGDIPVGMATASPLAGQGADITGPFMSAGIDIGSTFYFGESVLLPQFRRMGIGHRFFEEREAAARAAGATIASFCAVVRERNHPQRPDDGWDLTEFWHRRGYRPVAGLQASMRWKEVNQRQEVAHPMQFWTRNL